MISKATFNISINSSIDYLKKIKLFKDIGPKERGKHSLEGKKISRSNKHTEIYKSIKEFLDYEIILFDDSFFQFSHEENKLRFVYIQNPRKRASKIDYLKKYLTDEFDSDFTEDDFDGLVNEEEYEQFLNEQEINTNLVYIRYDFDKSGYKPLLHSCSHIHIGLSENFRIPSSLILTPLQFVQFCSKQCYHEEFKEYYSNLSFINFVKEMQKFKTTCHKITDLLTWSKDEIHEIYLS